METLKRINDFIKGIQVSYSGGFAIIDIMLWCLFIYFCATSKMLVGYAILILLVVYFIIAIFKQHS